MRLDNGMLSIVPGDCIALGIQFLPAADTASTELLTYELDAREAGHVRITYHRRRLRHRKLTHWYWHAVYAEPVPASDESQPNTPGPL